MGVANSVRAYLGRKRLQIATLRALGATRRFVTTLYLLQIGILTAIGIAIGLALGVAAPPIAAIAAGRHLPGVGAERVVPRRARARGLFGTLTALTFALFPLARADRIRPIVLLTRARRMSPTAFRMGSRRDGMVRRSCWRHSSF